MAAVNTAAILLAGGRSLRMGCDKTALELNGETLVERHLRQLREIGIANAIVVCHKDNEMAIQGRTGGTTVRQTGHNMSSAVLSGLQAVPTAGAVWAVCVNDVVGDADYRRLAEFPTGAESIVVPTRVLERVFGGGYLELSNNRTHVRAIIEKPVGGCPPGTMANIMIHRITGRELLSRLSDELAAGQEYEPVVNSLIRSGIPVSAVPLDFWIAIKTPEDFERARELLQ
jgi:NDP-sugar pyrophosphorylase family protein